MSLRLILGPAGSGKTTYLYQELVSHAERDPGWRAIAVVPEQYTMQTQKDLVSLHSRHSVMNIDILSFERMAYRVIEEQGTAHMTVLDDMGKTLVLRRAAGECQDQLRLYGRNLNKAGFIDRVKSVLSELYQYRIGAKELGRLTEELDDEPLLKQKLEEIRTLYQAFDQSLAQDTIPSERLYDVLCRLIPDSRLIRDSVISFDGFTGFTPAQYQVLKVLMQYAGQVIVTVTVDPDLTEKNASSESDPRKKALDASRRQLFDLSLTTIRTLHEMAQEAGTQVESPVILPAGTRFASAGDLAFLERNFLRCPSERYEGVPEHLSLWEAKDKETELMAVARQIFNLVRDEGYRYRDIAVIASDISGYEPVICRVFDRCGIPYFIDVKNNMLGHPVVAYLRGALEAIERDYSYETMFACLKSGMTPIPENDLYELENYVLAMGIRGRRAWSQEWTQTYQEEQNIDLARLNEVRVMVAEPLFALQDAMNGRAKSAAPVTPDESETAQSAASGSSKDETSVRDYAEALVVFMESQGLEERLLGMADNLRQDGESRLADEYEQVYGKILDLLDEVVDLYGDGHISLREWREILDTGFSEIRVGVIPAYVDRVVAGDMRRTRLKDPKVIFFVGANDGLVPMVSDSGSLLTDQDRHSLEKHGVQLAPSGEENGFLDRFYLYLTLTRPSERLCVSWCRQNVDGCAMLPSYLIGELRELYPELMTVRTEDHAELPEQILSRQTACAAMLQGLAAYREGSASECWKELYGIFASDPDEQDRLRRCLDAAFMTYHEESIDPAAARDLYGDALTGSVTRLEKYASCACAQFLTYGLKLTERREHTFEAADMGTLLHEAIQRLFAIIYGSGDAFDALSEGRGMGTGSAGRHDAAYSETYDQGQSAVPVSERVLKDSEFRRSLVHQCLMEAVEAEGDRGLAGSARGEFMLRRIEQIADRTCWALCTQLARGDFIPENVEVEFDGRTSTAMNVELDQNIVMRLHGRIDRVDSCQTDNKAYVKIVDYKTGSTSLDLDSVYYGLQLQLVMYLDAAMEREKILAPDKEVIPAGILYYNIKDPIVSVDPSDPDGADDQAVNDEILKELKMNGLVNSDRIVYRHMDHMLGSDAPPVIPVTEKDGSPVERSSSLADTGQFLKLCDTTRKKIRKYGNEIMAGRISADPYKKDGRTGCDYCPYRSVCGFDRKIPGYAYRQLSSMKPEEVWKALKEDSQENNSRQAGSQAEE